MKVPILLLGLVCFSLLLDGVHLTDPTEERFKKDHVVKVKEFRKIGTDPAKWDALSQQRGTGQKSTNTFIIANSYKKDILPSLQNGEHLKPDEKGSNLWKSNRGFKQIEIKRDDQGVMSEFGITKNKPFVAGMNPDPKSRQLVPVHFEGFASNSNIQKLKLVGKTGVIEETLLVNKKPQILIASDKVSNPRIRAVNPNNVDAFFKTKDTKNYVRALPKYSASPASSASTALSNVQNRGTNSRNTLRTGTTSITRPIQTSQNNRLNHRGSTGQMFSNSGGISASGLNSRRNSISSGMGRPNTPVNPSSFNSPAARARSSSMSMPSFGRRG